MRGLSPPPRSYLYAPGSEPRKIEKALAGDADAVVIDLEDAVAQSRKEQAREIAVGFLEAEPPKPVLVRINSPESTLGVEDIEAVCGPNLAGLRLPKTESPQTVRYVAERLGAQGCDAGIQCLIESALGLQLSFEIARAHEAVVGISLGEADLRADLGIETETGLLYARSKIVATARAAGLPRPFQSIYADIRNLEGLKRSSQEGRNLGFLGRTALHPQQVPVINAVFTPTEEEVEGAAQLLERLEEAAEAGEGGLLLEDGSFVDEAMARTARLTLALARNRKEEVT